MLQIGIEENSLIPISSDINTPPASLQNMMFAQHSDVAVDDMDYPVILSVGTLPAGRI